MNSNLPSTQISEALYQVLTRLCSGPQLTIRVIADCPSYRDQRAPEAVKAWLIKQYENTDDPPPPELAIWLKRVADNTQALNEACATQGK